VVIDEVEEFLRRMADGGQESLVGIREPFFATGITSA
jgi:hypothetical protein